MNKQKEEKDEIEYYKSTVKVILIILPYMLCIQQLKNEIAELEEFNAYNKEERMVEFDLK